MKQNYKKNKKYEVLTPQGWEDFDGIFENEAVNKPAAKIYMVGGNITATLEHRVFINEKEIKVSELKIGDILDSKLDFNSTIIDIKQFTLENSYDLFNVTNHVIIANGIHSHQCDEFAFVRPTIAKEFWTSIRPTLATGGGAIITSTPNSDEDQFALIWKQANKTEDEYGNTRTDGCGINGFKAYSADWRHHPDRDQEWADEERAAIGDERFRREHLNEFLIYDETLIAATKLIDMEGIEPIRKSGQVRWYSEPKPGMIYTVALDPSLGTGGDPAAIQVFEANTTKQIAEWKHNKSTIPVQIRILADIVQYVVAKCQDNNSVYFSVENNTIGEAALISIDEYGEQNIGGVFLSSPKDSNSNRRYRKGFNTTNKNKLAACAKLKNMVESDKMTISSKGLITELKHFVALGVGYAAKPGEHDDLVMALILTIRMLQILKDYHQELSSNLRDYGDDIVAPLPFIVSF